MKSNSVACKVIDENIQRCKEYLEEAENWQIDKEYVREKIDNAWRDVLKQSIVAETLLVRNKFEGLAGKDEKSEQDIQMYKLKKSMKKINLRRKP